MDLFKIDTIKDEKILQPEKDDKKEDTGKVIKITGSLSDTYTALLNKYLKVNNKEIYQLKPTTESLTEPCLNCIIGEDINLGEDDVPKLALIPLADDSDPLGDKIGEQYQRLNKGGYEVCYTTEAFVQNLLRLVGD